MDSTEDRSVPSSGSFVHCPNECGCCTSSTEVRATTYLESGSSAKRRHRDIVVIKFYNADELVFTNAYKVGISVHDLTRDVSIVFGVRMKDIRLCHNGTVLDETFNVTQFDLAPHETLELTIDTPEPLTPIPKYDEMVVPDIITVQLAVDETLYKEVVIEIEDRKIEKPFVGGYRHVETDVEYNHAYTQTGPHIAMPADMKGTRETQTYFYRNRLQETKCMRATQMTSTETWIPTVTDKILTSGKYTTADELERLRDVVNKVRTIQRYFRAWKIKTGLKVLHEEYVERVENERKNEMERKADEERRKLYEVVDKVYPRTRADFDSMYAMLNKWKAGEINRISQMYTKAPRLAEYAILLEKEIAMLRTIDEHRRAVKEDNRKQREIDFLNRISAPIKWNGYKNLLISMDTLNTQKARRYKGYYFSLCDYSVPVEKRMETLLRIKKTFKDHVCVLTQELVSLIDRECELLIRDVAADELETLRKRIQVLFLEHVKAADCNTFVMKRPRGLREIGMHDNMHMCSRCNVLKSYTQFPLHSRVEKLKVCAACRFIDTSDAPAVDIAPYRFMLEQVRKYERKKHCPSSVAYMMCEKDVFDLVENVWHAQSVLSEKRDLSDLRLVRWHVDRPWSPWNCVLLTRDEADSHLRVRDLHSVYGESIRRQVMSKHVLAKKCFAAMVEFCRAHDMSGVVEHFDFVAVPTQIVDEDDMDE